MLNVVSQKHKCFANRDIYITILLGWRCKCAWKFDMYMEDFSYWSMQAAIPMSRRETDAKGPTKWAQSSMDTSIRKKSMAAIKIYVVMYNTIHIRKNIDTMFTRIWSTLYIHAEFKQAEWRLSCNWSQLIALQSSFRVRTWMENVIVTLSRLLFFCKKTPPKNFTSSSS